MEDEYPDKNSWRNYLIPKILPWVRPFEEELIFCRSAPEPKINPPAEYAPFGLPTLADFKAERLDVPSEFGSTKLGLWVREPDDDTKPIYVVFHGRKGNWAYAGLKKEHDDNTDYNRRFRMGWLDTIAGTGAGVIAIHTRGHGLSRGPDLRTGEQAFRDDINVLADYLIDDRRIDPRRIIITGESMGGALATMLAEKMTKKGHPPAVLGLVNSFACLPDAAAQSFRSDGYLLPALSTIELQSHPDAEAICRHHSAIMRKSMKNQFDTVKRIGTLDPAHTRLYIVNNPKDLDIPFDQHAKLNGAAATRGLHTKSRILQDEDCVPGQSIAHINWDPKKIVQDLQELYLESPKPSRTDRRPPRGSSGRPSELAP